MFQHFVEKKRFASDWSHFAWIACVCVAKNRLRVDFSHRSLGVFVLYQVA